MQRDGGTDFGRRKIRTVEASASKSGGLKQRQPVSQPTILLEHAGFVSIPRDLELFLALNCAVGLLTVYR